MDNAPIPCFQKPNLDKENKNIELIEKKEFQIDFKNTKYDIILSKTIDKQFLVLQCYERDNKYNILEARLTFDDLIKINKSFKICESIDDVYKLIYNKFNENKIFIQETKDYKIKILYFSLKNIITGEEQKIEIEIKNDRKDSFLMDEFGKKYENLLENIKMVIKENEKIKKILKDLSEEKIKMENKINIMEENMNNMKKENENLKKEIELLKNNFKNINIPLGGEKVDPLKLSLKKTISEEAYCPCLIENTFAVFKSRINNNILLVYRCKNNSIKFDDIIYQKNIKIIEKAHDENIISIKYFDDTINNKDLILSLSGFDKMIKIWDISNWECISKIVSLKNDNNSFISSACLLFNKEENYAYIISSSYSEYDDIKIFSLQGNDLGKIKNSMEDKSYFLDVYFNKKQKKYYIISANNKNVKSYDFSNKNLYKKYFDGNSNNDHMSAKIYENKGGEEINLIESSVEGYVNIWNFHSGQILKKIECCKGIQLRGLCIWDDDNLFVGGDDNSIKLIDFKNGKLLKSFSGQSGTICSLAKIFIPKLGDCLISGANNYEQIKLWCE